MYLKESSIIDYNVAHRAYITLFTAKTLYQYFSAKDYKSNKKGIWPFSPDMTQVYGAAAATLCLKCSETC
jgi:hypothetical protein